jgi:hypothetical protein
VTGRLTSRGMVFVLVLVAASVTLISGSRQWVSGTVNDVVLGSGALSGTGSDTAPGVMAAALVGLASAVVVATSGRVLRIVAAWATLLAAALGVAVVVSVLADPEAALSRLATAGTGRSGGALAVHGQIGGWAWVAFAAMLVMGVGALAALAGRSPRGAGGTAGEQGRTQTASVWDQLSRGDDPTT